MSFVHTSSRNIREGPEWNLGTIFGREKESQRLDEIAFETSSRQVQSTIILHGTAGSGKSSLIQNHPWEEQGWLLAYGKFEHRRIAGEPFSALIAAFNSLVDTWIVQNSVAEVCRLGGFQQLLEEDFEFMQNILPKVYQTIITMGPCPMNAADKAVRQKRNLFLAMQQPPGTVDCIHASFVRLLQSLCKTQKIVLFIDDIHWADKASLDVLKVLTSGSAGIIYHLLIVLSYRAEEVTEEHPTMLTINAVKETVELEEEKQEIRIHDMPLVNLNVESVNCFLAAITRHDKEETLALAEIIHNKTAGNPFFVTQFILMLRRECFLTYSFSTFRWEWGDVSKLANASHVCDNVADVIANSLETLPVSTRIAVKVASCLGKIVPLDVLVAYFEEYEESQEGETCCLALHQIKESELCDVLESAVKLGILIKTEGQDVFMWAHDNLQDVSYSHIREEFRGSLHLKLGKVLWRMSLTHPDEEWMVFMAADQLKRYSDYQKHQVLGIEVAMLCFEAANLSLSKSALVPAYEMVAAGVKHLSGEDRWTIHYELSVQLYSTLAELSFQLGKQEEAMNAVAEVQQNAKAVDDKFHVECVLLKSITSGKDRDYLAGIKKTLEILKEYGIKFPSKLLPGQVSIENQKLKQNLPGRSLSAMLDLPEMTDRKSLHVMKLLVEFLGMFVRFGQHDSNLYCYAASRALNLSAKKGVCQHTALAIVAWAAQLCENGHFKEAEEYAEMGLKVIQRFPRSVGSLHGRVIGAAASLVFCCTRPLNANLDLFLDSHHISLRTGNTEWAAMPILAYAITYLSVGLPLDSLKSDLLLYEKEARQFRIPETVIAHFSIFQQFIVNLQDDVAMPGELKGAVMDENQLLGTLEGPGYRMTKRDIHTFRLLLASIYGYWDMAEMLLTHLEPFLDNDAVITRSSFRRTFMALVALRLARTKGKKQHRNLGKKVMKELERSLKHGNVNTLPIYLMLQAEESPSKQKYDEAIRACARLGLIHYEAYLCERAGEFFLEQKDEGWSEYYLAQAIVLWEDWGARGKANRMKAEHPELLASTSIRAKATTALKGRTRYSSEHADLLKVFNWERRRSVNNGNGSYDRKDII